MRKRSRGRLVCSSYLVIIPGTAEVRTNVYEDRNGKFRKLCDDEATIDASGSFVFGDGRSIVLGD